MLKKIFYLFQIVSLFLAIIYVNKANAIPYWSRKYKTDCHTCHFHFPKLNSMGEAFRKLGFRFPAGPYEDRIENESVHGGVIESLPISVDLTTISELERDEGISFNDFGGDFLILSGGTINKNISFYGSLNFFVEGDSDDIDVIIPRMHVIYNPFKNPLFNIKAGRFEPRVLGVSNFRTITQAYGMLNKRVGDNDWNLEPYQQGIEFNGIFGKGRFAYSAGIVEGKGNKQNDFKDFYGRIEHKFGGLRLDGTNNGEEFNGLISNTWRDNSVTFGIFGYHGEADVERVESEDGFSGIDSFGSRKSRSSRRVRALHTPGLGGDSDDEDDESNSESDRFSKIGMDINVLWEKWNVIAAYALQHHDSPLAGNPGQAITEHQAFFEVDYAFSHWFEPTVRYEVFLQENERGMLQRIQPQLNFHLGQVLHLFIAEDFVKDVGDTGFSATTGIAGFDIVF